MHVHHGHGEWIVPLLAVGPGPGAVHSRRNGWGTYDTDIYAPDEQGALVLVKRIHKEPAEDDSGELKTTVQVLTDGQWREVTD